MAERYTTDEMMIIAAARLLQDGARCFVGIGLPSAAANLARLTTSPEIVLIYESGTIGTKPEVLPLSIGDGELAETADFVVSVPEMFRYWLQGGWIDVGFLGAAQIDRYGNLNTTVIGPYGDPKVRLPGAGGAPDIAMHSKEVFVMLRQGKRSFVEQLDFITTPGFLKGRASREKAGLTSLGPTQVITDLGVLHPDHDGELELVSLHPGVTAEQAVEATGWPLKIADRLEETPAPTDLELNTLRALQERTARAHEGVQSAKGAAR